MQDEGESPLPCFLRQDRRHVLVGAAAVDDERQLRPARSLDVPAKARLLVFGLLRVVEIIEACLADRDDLLVAFSQPHQLVGGDVQLFGSIVRMCSDGAEDRGIAGGQRQQVLQLAHPRRDCHHLLHADRMGARDQIVALIGEIGKIRMAVRIDQHDGLLSR